jgi:hypothetical protein
MPISLWQGDRLLGALHIRPSSSAKKLEAVLIPNADALPLSGVWQHEDFIPGSTAILQDIAEPDIVEERHKKPIHEDSGPVHLTLIPPGEPRGVPREQQLYLRTDDGTTINTRNLTLLEHRPHPKHPDPEIATLPASALITGSVWLVWASPGLPPQGT